MSAYVCIWRYMYVYASICMYVYVLCVYAYMNVYGYCMHVYVCIWCVCTYFVCICMYFLKWHPQTREKTPPPLNTATRGGYWRATLRAPLGIWASAFFRPWKSLCRLDLARPSPRHASRAPGAALSFLMEVSHTWSAHYNPVPLPYMIRALQSSPTACHSGSGRLASIQRPEPPLKNTSRQQFNDVCMCMYMYVYVCICMYMYVYACMCMFCVYICSAQVMYWYRIFKQNPLIFHKKQDFPANHRNTL